MNKQNIHAVFTAIMKHKSILPEIGQTIDVVIKLNKDGTPNKRYKSKSGTYLVENVTSKRENTSHRVVTTISVTKYGK